MNIILFSKGYERPTAFLLGRFHFYAAILAAVLLVGIGFFVGGYWMGSSKEQALDSEVVQTWKQRLGAQKQEVADAKEQAQASLNALALRIGQLQAQVMRLNALGQRLTKMAKLDKGEFDFSKPPAQGGPEDPSETQSQETPDIINAMDSLAARLNDQERQLNVLETMILHSNLQKRVFPAGRPIKHGWLSSYYGKRVDPFNGKQEFHSGLDFAGKEGSAVVAVAAGVVTWAGPRYGYGNLVELDHGNGYVTRYAHNEKILVKVGAKVKKGEKIALMGSTGRSTGPHVHFEVLYDGHFVNPEKYVKAGN